LKHWIAFCAGLSALAVAAATSAQAQIYGGPPDPYDEPPPVVERRPLIGPIFQPRLPPSEALMIVRASGLRPLTRPAVRGSHYVLLASDNMGGQLRVVVNGNNGRIMNASPAHDPRFAHEPVRRPRGLVPMPGPQQAAAPPPSQGTTPPPELREPSTPLPRTARATPPQTPAAGAGHGAGQDHRSVSAPDSTTATAPARPERTPLPRPRPQIASTETTASTAPAAAPAARETSPEAETTPAASAAPAPAAPSAAPAQPTQPTETQLVPVAPLD
jgi:hypothetical protein